jgi:hypothetical protein
MKRSRLALLLTLKEQTLTPKVQKINYFLKILCVYFYYIIKKPGAEVSISESLTRFLIMYVLKIGDINVAIQCSGLSIKWESKAGYL